jgi:TonB-linked SusC/RagA family outer membrane protein
MRKIFQSIIALSLGLLLLPQVIQAQERTVTGTILSEDNKSPLSGVTVKVKGTQRIVQTDANGKFSIRMNPGETLQITYVGYQTYEVKPTGDSVGISLKTSDNTMEEVIVTAMDIKRNPRSLGYSAQSVAGKEIAETQRENFLNSLQGRVAGLTINPTNGQAGASSQIILRGFNSLSLTNQPLFVVDGIILDNSTLNETSNGGSSLGLASDRVNRNNDYTNRIADINPSDIESVTVLKGPEATALYGSQASAGAIIITTKKAAPGKFSIAYDNSFRVTEVSRTLDLVDDYGPGTSGIPQNIFNTGSGSYFGPKYPAGTKKYNNIKTFFQTGFSQTHNLSADLGFKNVGFKVSGSFFDQKGVVPENKYRRYNVRVTNTTKIGKMLEITPSFQYINSTNDKPLRGGGGYLTSLYVWPVNNDIGNFHDAEGNKISIFSTSSISELDNPLYGTQKNHAQDKNERFIYSGGINFNPFKWLSIAGRFGYDTYQTSGYSLYHPLSYLGALNTAGTFTSGQLGALDNYWRKYHGYNHTITASATKKVGKFTGRLMAGTMWQDYKTMQFAIYGTGLVDSIGSILNTQGGYNKMYKKGQIVTEANYNQLVGSPTDSSITTPGTRRRLLRNDKGLYNKSTTRLFAYFGEASISYNNLLFLSYTHRFESASVFPKDLRDYDYPGFSFSAIISDIFPKMKGKMINYFKLRASRANTARLANPYSNQSVFVNNFTSSIVGNIYAYGFDNNNAFLRPEKQKTYEYGAEVRLFKSRLNVDIAYYNTLCTDQISNQFRVSYATGFILNTSNAASTRNQGVELTLDIGAIRKEDLSWNIRFNFNRPWSKVLVLPISIQREYYNAETWLYGNARGGIHLYGSTSTISGTTYQRNNQGKILISPTTGQPLTEALFNPIGDRAPDFTLGTLNTIRYKNWSLNFLWDLKVGGDIFNATDMFLTLQGKSKRTADRERPRIVDGVIADGLQNTSNPTINTISIVPYFQQGYYTGMPEEEFIEHDVDWFRLKDITLSYILPENILKNLKIFKTLGLFITGTDMVLLTNYRGADPAVSGNTAASNGTGSFGFDFGNLPAPLSINFGLKATFK